MVTGWTAYVLFTSRDSAGEFQSTLPDQGWADTVSSVLPSSAVQKDAALAKPRTAPDLSSGFQANGSSLLLRKTGSVQGSPVRSLPSRHHPQTLKGRTIALDSAPFSRWDKIQEGDEIALPGFDEDTYSGKVQLRDEDNGWLRIGGVLKDQKGTFSLHLQGSQVAGTIRLPAEGVGLELCTEPSGETVLVERLLSRLVCWNGPSQFAAAQSDGQTGDTSATSPSQIPQINTRPGSRGLIYLNFGGATVKDVDWNGGAAIEAAPSNLSSEDIREVVARVAEDYAPFDMAISTIAADYENTLPGRRMRVIITPTNFDQDRPGGLAAIGSWRSSGKIKSSTIPAWVFNATKKTIAEAVSHEVGHTLGLAHHGTLSPAYYDDQQVYHPAVKTISEYFGGYDGLGGRDSATSWAPIMGNSYTRPLTQWSKGEYPNANNSDQDDLAVISDDWNDVGFRAEPPGSKLIAPDGLSPLSIVGGTFSASGILRKADIPNRYQFATHGGSWAITAKPAAPQFTNADLQLELWRISPLSSDAELVAKASPPELLESFLRIPDLSEGTYQIVVRAAGTVEGNHGVYANGYSPYGSVGAYQINGIIENPDVKPTISTPPMIKALLGSDVRIPVSASKGAQVTQVSGTLPPGISWNKNTNTLEGNPTEEGHYEIIFRADSDRSSRTQSLQFFAEVPDIPLPVIDGIPGVYYNSPTAPWVGKLVAFRDLTLVKAAASGRIVNGGNSRLRFIIPGKRTVSFWWKTSSEAGHDGLECRLNGVIPNDLISGKAVKLSGRTDWVLQKVRVETTGNSILEFAYAKDGTLSEGEDRGWVTNVQVGLTPLFKKSPSSVRLKAADRSLNLSAVVENADSFQWKKDGIALADESRSGHQITGAQTPNLNVIGVTAADSGAYTLEAKNAFDTVASRRADVVVPAAPLVGNATSPISAVTVGEPLILGVEALGATPYVSLWRKDGRLIRRVNGTTLKLGDALPSMSGTYSVTVTNSFGSSASKLIPVTIIPSR